jgi:hypothetical protein
MLISLLIAYIVSTFLMGYVAYGTKPFVNTTLIAEEFRNLSQSLKTRISNFSAPLARLPQSNTTPDNNVPISVTPLPPSGQRNSSGGIVLSTLPTSAPSLPPPTVPVPKRSDPTLPLVTPTSKPKPTGIPKPTEKPLPTAEPTPVLPAGYVRPGKTIDEVFNIAAQKSCVPANLLKAFVAQEAPGVLTWSDKSVELYNAYDWWHRVTEKKQVCSGYGWYPETGLIPDDSNFAGEKCKEGINGDTVSKSLGAGQMLEYYWNKTFKKKAETALGVESADRRVVLDALVGFGINIKEGTKNPGGCDDWEFKYIIKAACVNTGGGSAYSYYYGIICRNYNKYANQNNNCDNVASMIIPDSFCQLK